jgi:hypothetical protein
VTDLLGSADASMYADKRRHLSAGAQRRAAESGKLHEPASIRYVAIMRGQDVSLRQRDHISAIMEVARRHVPGQPALRWRG